MHGLIRGVWRFLLLSVILFPSLSLAAGLDFNLLFGKKVTSDRVGIANRQFNTLTGPADGQRLFTGLRLVPSGVSNQFLALDWHTVTRINGFTGAYSPEPAVALDLNDWPMSLTYDTTANRAILVTLGGEGALYQRPANGSAWSTLARMQNDDLDSLVYFPAQNSFWGLRTYGGAPDVPSATLVRYSPQGAPVDYINLGALPVNISPGWHKSQLVALDQKIALLVEPYAENSFGPEDLSRIYLIDPFARTIQLTWQAVPQPPSVPIVHFISPADGSHLPVTRNQEFVFTVFDPEGDIRTVELFDEGASIKRWNIYTNAPGTNTFRFNYALRNPAEHTFTARATDFNGHTNEDSTTIQILSGPELIRITTPVEGAQFRAGTNILITAVGSEAAPIASIWFHADGQTINSFRPTNNGLPQTISAIWSNAPAGEHSLTAVAYVLDTAIGWYAISAPVRITVAKSFPIMTVTRDLPPFYIPGEPLEIRLDAKLTPAVNAWAVEEIPPPGWIVREFNSGGVYDSVAKKIKWGPFADNANVVLSYKLFPPLNAIGTIFFAGASSANGVSQKITGDTSFIRGQLYHPADAPEPDWKLTVNEVTAYASAWKAGQPWPRPPAEIPLSYVTRAGFIWRYSETYHFDAQMVPPNCWLPTAEVGTSLKTSDLLAADLENIATRKLAPAFTPGLETHITIQVSPTLMVQAFALEEIFPAGWEVVDAGIGTVVDSGIRFGPFFDHEPRILNYTLRPPANALRGEFSGRISFDGSDESTRGDAAIRQPQVIAEASDDRRIHLRFNTTPGQSFVLETTDRVENLTWDTLSTIDGAESTIEFPAIEAAESQKFFRLRPLTPPSQP